MLYIPRSLGDLPEIHRPDVEFMLAVQILMGMKMPSVANQVNSKVVFGVSEALKGATKQYLQTNDLLNS